MIVFIVPLTLGLVLSCHSDGASPQSQPTEAQIFEALKPKVHKRGLARPIEDVEQRTFIARLRNRSAHSLTIEEREKAAVIAGDSSSIDLEITFEFNSATVDPRQPVLFALGRALSREGLKGSVFLINGHTDAKGGIEYNQDLSERRAEAVRHLLVQQYRLPGDTLIAVGYGKDRLKNTTTPFAAENRRVQVVNVSAR